MADLSQLLQAAMAAALAANETTSKKASPRVAPVAVVSTFVAGLPDGDARCLAALSWQSLPGSFDAETFPLPQATAHLSARLRPTQRPSGKRPKGADIYSAEELEKAVALSLEKSVLEFNLLTAIASTLARSGKIYIVDLAAACLGFDEKNLITCEGKGSKGGFGYICTQLATKLNLRLSMEEGWLIAHNLPKKEEAFCESYAQIFNVAVQEGRNKIAGKKVKTAA